MRCWDLRSRNAAPIQVLEGATDSVSAIAASSHEIIAGSIDGHVLTFDVRKGSVAREVLISLDEWKRMQSMVESDAAGGSAEELRYEQEDDASVPDEFEGEYRN